MIDDPLYVAVDLLRFSRVAFPGLSWGELLNREEESDDEGMDQRCDRGGGRRVVPVGGARDRVGDFGPHAVLPGGRHR